MNNEKASPKVLIYADGSCLRNGSEFAQAGAGVVMMTEDRRRIKLKASYLGALTNQKAEILACAVGLESLKQPCKVRMFSDSKYVVETMLGANRRNANREFWERLINACLGHKIEWNWVRGHNGNAFQETADRLSRAAAITKENLDKETLDRLAGLLLDKPDDAVIKMIHDGLKTLAAACDGARRADGQGFNKSRQRARAFARRKTRAHRAGCRSSARELLGKYRGQIASFDGQLAMLV